MTILWATALRGINTNLGCFSLPWAEGVGGLGGQRSSVCSPGQQLVNQFPNTAKVHYWVSFACWPLPKKKPNWWSISRTTCCLACRSTRINKKAPLHIAPHPVLSTAGINTQTNKIWDWVYGVESESWATTSSLSSGRGLPHSTNSTL